MHFSKHYTLAEARALLPQVRQWLEEVETRRRRLLIIDPPLALKLAKGFDLGGAAVNEMVALMVELQGILRQFQTRQIQVKDLERGLIDFPSLREGREVFLCWEKDEDDIEFWHDLESGYAGRERI